MLVCQNRVFLIKLLPFQIIPIVVGQDADPDEMTNITPTKGNVLKTNDTEPPTDLAKRIMNKAIYGKMIKLAMEH